MFGSKSISHRDFKLVKNKSRKTSSKKGADSNVLAPIPESAFIDKDLVSQFLVVSETPLLAQKV